MEIGLLQYYIYLVYVRYASEERFEIVTNFVRYFPHTSPSLPILYILVVDRKYRDNRDNREFYLHTHTRINCSLLAPRDERTRSVQSRPDAAGK